MYRGILGLLLLLGWAATASALTVNCLWPDVGPITANSSSEWPCGSNSLQDPNSGVATEAHAYTYATIPGTSQAGLRVQINDNDRRVTAGDGHAERREVRWPASANICTQAFDGQGCWYGFSIWVAPESASGGDSGDIWKDRVTGCGAATLWHQTDFANDACDDDFVREGWSIQTMNSNSTCGTMQWRFAYREDSAECTPVGFGAANITNLGNVARGTLTTFVVYNRFSTRNGTYGAGSTLNANGAVKVWMNGAVVLDRTGVVVGMNNNANQNMAFNAAMYVSQFEGSGGAQPTSDIIVSYYGPVKICNETTEACDFNAVNPTAGGVTVASAIIPSATPNRIIVCVNNVGTPPMIPATGITGWTYTCDETSTAMTLTKHTDSCVKLTLNSGNFTATDDCTVSYSQSTGNYTNTDGIELATTNNFPVDNQSPAAPDSLRQVDTRCYTPNLAESAFNSIYWRGNTNETCDIPQGSVTHALLSLRVEAGAFTGVPRLFCNDGSGEYRVENTYGANGVRYATDQETTHGTVVASTCRLATGGATCVDRTYYINPASSGPVKSVTHGGTNKQLEYQIALESTLAVGATSTCQLKEEGGTAFSNYNNNLLLRGSGRAAFHFGG